MTHNQIDLFAQQQHQMQSQHQPMNTVAAGGGVASAPPAPPGAVSGSSPAQEMTIPPAYPPHAASPQQALSPPQQQQQGSAPDLLGSSMNSSNPPTYRSGGTVNDLDSWINQVTAGQCSGAAPMAEDDMDADPIEASQSPAAPTPIPADVPSLQKLVQQERDEAKYWKEKYDGAQVALGDAVARQAEMEQDVQRMSAMCAQLQQQLADAAAAAAVAKGAGAPCFPCANRRCSCTVAVSDTFCSPSCQGGSPCAQPVHRATAASPTAQFQTAPQQQQQQQPAGGGAGAMPPGVVPAAATALPQITYPGPRHPKPGAEAPLRLDSNKQLRCPHCRQAPRIPGVEFCHNCSMRLETGYRQVVASFHGQPIRFYEKNQPFYEFTNFYPVKIEYEGRIYRNTEALFQAAKFMYTAPQVADMIRQAKFPREAFDLAHQYYQYERKDWMEVRDDWMLLALRLKFKNPHMRRILMLTDPLVLIENTKNDKYWGNNGDDTGKNRLGALLMQVRHEISINQL